jgi:hypothetical protein
MIFSRKSMRGCNFTDAKQLGNNLQAWAMKK